MTDQRDRDTRPVGDEGSTTSLVALRADFPAFRIWREIIPDRTRYIARRVRPGPGLHTVVTDDLTEMRAELSNAAIPLSGRARARTGR